MKYKLIGVLLVVLCPAAALAQSLEGVWMMDEVIVGGGDFEGRHTADIQPAFWIYTKSHYSRQWVGGYEPRPVYEQGEATDEELLEVWRRFGANAGKYEVQGSTITYTPIVAKNPEGMTDNSYTVKLEWDGDGFWLTFDTNGGWQNRAHYVRLDD